MTFRLKDEQVVFYKCQLVQQSYDMWVVLVKETINDDIDACDVPIGQGLGVNELAVVIMNFESHDIKEYDEMVKSLHGRGSY